MAERYRSLFFTILSLTIIWLIVILLCLPQNDNVVEQWTTSNSPHLAPSSEDSSFDRLEDPPKTSYTHHYERKRSRTSENLSSRELDFVKFIQSPIKKTLDTVEVLFYEFDTNSLNLETPPSSNENILSNNYSKQDKSKHDTATLEHGTIRNPSDQFIKSRGDELFAFNLLVSNRIGLFRKLPDSRNEKCNGYLATIGIDSSSDQPPSLFPTTNSSHHSTLAPFTNSGISAYVIKLNLKASIIICYYNEAPSALLRTIYTVLERSPPQLLKEILVIDDSSSDEFHYEKICKPFISSKLVTFSRTNRREGLIRARIFGAKLAKGDVLVFLDSHVEANIGWLEPLLETIHKNKTTIACPMIDLINAETLIYSASPMVKGGLNWSLNFKWDSVPSNKLRTYEDFIRPIESPTMAGGLYAIHRDFFYHLGEYDSEMELWGGENVELSLRTWMCGGRILILPCSRLGHIFRKRRPYGPEPNKPDSLLFNSHRTALIWLGEEYIQKFYEAQPLAIGLTVGDISQRLQLKEKLNCHNFTWFIDNIYPSLEDNLVVDGHKESNRMDKQASAQLFNFEQRKRPDRIVTDMHHSSQVTVRRSQRQVQPHYSSRFLVENLNKGNHLFISENSKQINQMQLGPKSLSDHTSEPSKMIRQFQIQSVGSEYCIESKGGYLAKSFTRLILNHCAYVQKKTVIDTPPYINRSEASLVNQLWTETKSHDFRLGDNQCLDLIKNLPLLRQCHSMGSFQVWKTSQSQKTENKVQNQSVLNTNIYNLMGGLCLGVERVQPGEPIIVTICDTPVEREETIKLTRMRNTHKQYPEKVYPYWYTGSSFTTLNRFRSKGLKKNPTMLKPNQKWNLIFVDSSIEPRESTSTPSFMSLTTTNSSSLTTTSSPSNSTSRLN